MKLLVVTPSADYADHAGARIRYLRLSDSFERLGTSLSLVPIDAFEPARAQCDVALFSKCYDARALITAAVLSRRGIPVGIDLFDDYFSQESDSRLSRFRTWLSQALEIADFVLCSTEVMASVARTYGARAPVHVLHDPAPAYDEKRLAESLDRKVAEANRDGLIRVCWFGIGDNPYFPVGLSDLAAFADELEQLSSGGAAVELTVLTNARSLNASGLAMIAQLPVSAVVEEWTEERERQVLDRSLVAFLPVNAQRFSTAKSLNRAVTALTSGCQVLSAGFPLYHPLDRFIYRDGGALVQDLEAKRPKLSSVSCGALRQEVGQIASSPREAERLASLFAHVLTAAQRQEAAHPIFLLHGFSTSPAAHELVKAAGGLSIATPFCTAELEFDGIVRLTGTGEPYVLVSDRARARLTGNGRKRTGPQSKVGRWTYSRLLDDSAAEPKPSSPATSLPLQLAQYKSVMAHISASLPELFGPGQTIISENSDLPVEAI
jgi:hypothetical protein